MPPKYFRYNLVVAGSGSAAFNDESVADIVIRQANKIRTLHPTRFGGEQQKPITVSYVGICTYDSLIARERQVGKLEQKGCKILDINVTWPKLTRPLAELRADILSSDVVLFSGGNTLYAMRRFVQMGLDKVFAEAAELGIILAGGSAGSIIPFDAGHSDSADPTTFRPKEEPEQQQDNTNNVEAATAEPEANQEKEGDDVADWKYIRVSALGLFPGLVCPHHDRTQSNGVPRYIDFDEMLLKRHDCERGICLDHWCVLIVEEGGTYELFAVPQMTGSVVVPGGFESYSHSSSSTSGPFLKDATFDTKNAEAIPGLWIKDVEIEALGNDGENSSKRIKARCCAPKGKLEDILRVCPKEKMIEEKAEEDAVMAKNKI
jgi:dipeptidase E